MMSNGITNTSEDGLRNIYNTIELKIPGLVTDKLKNAIVTSIEEMTKKGESCIVIDTSGREGMRAGKWRLIFTFNEKGDINIAGHKYNNNLAGYQSKFRSLMVIKVFLPEDDHFVFKYLTQEYNAGNLSLSEYNKLKYKFNLLPLSIRNRFTEAFYYPDSSSFKLHINSLIKITMSSKGFTLVTVTIYTPTKIEFKIPQKYLPQIDVILKHHW